MINPDTLPDPTDVRAPHGAIGWTPMRGWLDDHMELDEAMMTGEVVLTVDDDGVCRDVEGEAPLASLMRVDRVAFTLVTYVDILRTALVDLIAGREDR